MMLERGWSQGQGIVSVQVTSILDFANEFDSTSADKNGEGPSVLAKALERAATAHRASAAADLKLARLYFMMR